MEGSLEAPPPTPATPNAPVDRAAGPLVPPAFSFDLSKGFRRSGPRCLVRVDRHAHTAPRSLQTTGPATCVLHAYSALTCLSLFWERTGLLYLYLEGLSLFGGPYEYIWRAPSLFGGPYECEGFCMWRAYPSPPLSATRMRISASCLYIGFSPMLFWKSASLTP